MLIQRRALDSPKIETALVDTDLALKHRIETLAALLSTIMEEVDRLRTELVSTTKYPSHHKSKKDLRQASINDEGIDFYREIELYEIELIKRALHRVRGSLFATKEILGGREAVTPRTEN